MPLSTLLVKWTFVVGILVVALKVQVTIAQDQNFIWFDSSMSPNNWRNQFNIPVPRFPQSSARMTNFPRNQQQSPREKLFIVTDPDTGATFQIPAGVFFERFGATTFDPATTARPTQQTPFICDLFTRNCWSGGNQPNSREGEATARPAVGGSIGGSTIFGHPNFHQGAFPEATTFRPWSQSNPVAASAQNDEAEVASKIPATGGVTSDRGGGGGSSIFGHPNFHQGAFPEPTTFRPFSPSNQGSFNGASSSSSSDNNGNTRFNTQIVSGRNGRIKRSPSPAPAHSGHSYSHQSSSFNPPSGYGIPHDVAKAQEQYLQQAYAAAAAAHSAAANSFGGFSGANANANANSFSGSFGGVQNSFPAGISPATVGYNGLPSGSSSARFGGSGSAYAEPASASSFSGQFSNSGAGGVGGSAYSGGSNGYNHHHYGDLDMKHSTHTNQNGAVETRMEGSKCDKNGCRTSFSSSTVHNPGGGKSYGGYSSSSHQSSSSSDYANQSRGRAYEQETTTKYPYTYATTTTTKKPYTSWTQPTTTTRYTTTTNSYNKHRS